MTEHYEAESFSRAVSPSGGMIETVGADTFLFRKGELLVELTWGLDDEAAPRDRRVMLLGEPIVAEGSAAMAQTLRSDMLAAAGALHVGPVGWLSGGPTVPGSLDEEFVRRRWRESRAMRKAAAER